MKGRITSKQKCFVEQYLVDLNGTQAAIRAGYSPRTARIHAAKLLTKPNIQGTIQKAQQERSKRTELTQDWVLLNLKAVVERCMQAEPILGREGKPTGEYRFDSAGANRALELLGKHLGLFEERLRIKNENTSLVSG